MGFEDGKSNNVIDVFDMSKSNFGLPVLKEEYQKEFDDWLKEKQGDGDKILSLEVYSEFAVSRQCLLNNTKLGCEAIKREKSRGNGSPQFETVSKRSLSGQIRDIWKKGDDIKYIRNIDIREAILAELKSAGSDLTFKSIETELKLIYALLKEGAYDKMADRIGKFVLNKFPAGKMSIFAVGIAHRLVIKGGSRKKHQKEHHEKKNEPKIRLRLSRPHLKGDQYGGGHFPAYRSKGVKYRGISTADGIRKADIWIPARGKWERKSIFPDGRGLDEAKAIRTALVRQRKAQILAGNKVIKLKFGGEYVYAVIKYVKKEKGMKSFLIKTMYPKK